MKTLSLNGSSLLLSTLLLASCEGISNAPKGAPRVELEVAVAIDSTYLDRLDGVGTNFANAVTNMVMSHSDVGLRFYAVSTDTYRSGDARPDYLLSVDISDLTVGIDHRKLSQESPEADPVLEAYPTRITCEVEAILVRRRSNGPDLTVDSAKRKGSASATRSKEGEEPVTYGLRRGEQDLPVSVREGDLVKSIEDGLRRALTDCVPAIDREIAFRPVTNEPAKK